MKKSVLTRLQLAGVIPALTGLTSPALTLLNKRLQGGNLLEHISKTWKVDSQPKMTPKFNKK